MSRTRIAKTGKNVAAEKKNALRKWLAPHKPTTAELLWNKAVSEVPSLKNNDELKKAS